MIMDNTLVFSDGQAITADAGSTNVIDLGATGTPYGAASALVRDIGKGGCNISLYVGVVEAFNTLTSLQISLQVDDNAAFSSAKTVAQSAAIPLADLTLGAEIAFPDYRSEEHTSELQPLMRISYADLRLKKKTQNTDPTQTYNQQKN